MARNINMHGDVYSFLFQKAWFVVILVIAILGNGELLRGDNEHAGKKLAVDNDPGT